MLTPIKAIRAKCLDCSNGSFKEVEHCPIERCPLYPYRFGKNPNLQHERTAAQLEALRKGRVPFQPVEETRASEKTATPEGKDTTPDISPENAQLNQ